MTDLLNRLPEFDPRPGLWSRIEADLDADEKLAQIVAKLPDFEPDDALWNRIDDALNTTDTYPEPARVLAYPATATPRLGQRIGQVRWWGTGMAVACMVVLGMWLFWPKATPAHERIEYAVEQTNVPADTNETMTDTPADERAEDFINRQCKEVALTCQKPEVRELRAQLGELATERNRLAAERQTFGDDPAIVQAQVKLENQRADVTKELITLLRS